LSIATENGIAIWVSMKTHWRIVGLFTALALVAGCSQQGDEGQANLIRVAVSPASPPNIFEENGEITGMDLEIFEDYCEARGCTPKITAYDWQGMLGAVVSGQADIAFSGISITDKREEVMDFSIPYLENTWNLMGLQARNIAFSDLSEWKQYSTGYPRGMAYTAFIKEQMEPQGLYSLDQVKLYPSYNEVLTDLKNGQIDLAFLDGTVASVYRKTLPIADAYVFSGFDRFGFAFPEGSPLRDDFNQYLTELGPERLRENTEKWLD
jgi:polar amino acid transport system substrate-binding protein